MEKVLLEVETLGGLRIKAGEKILLEQQIYVERLYPYSEAGKIALIRRRGRLVSEEYLAEGIQVKAYVPKEIYGKI